MQFSAVLNMFIVKTYLNSIFTNDFKRKENFSKNVQSYRVCSFKVHFKTFENKLIINLPAPFLSIPNISSIEPVLTLLYRYTLNPIRVFLLVLILLTTMFGQLMRCYCIIFIRTISIRFRSNLVRVQFQYHDNIWSVHLYTFMLSVCQQKRIWRDWANALARLSLGCMQMQ